MRKLILTGILQVCAIGAIACDACEKQQPKVLRGVVHGAGPDSKWDYVIVWATIVIVLLTLFYSVKWLIRPGERSEHHIKRFILNN